jgi:TetR/AcrR family transcriptional regulator, transcriptional repressor for nem operon
MSNTRNILIDTAINLFLGKGYGTVGTAEICRVAGINKGTFYHFFPSKTDLLVAAISRYAESVEAQFIKIAGSASEPRAQLTALFLVPETMNIAWQRDHGIVSGCLVGNMALELGATEKPVREAVMQAFSSWQSAILPIMCALQRTEEVVISHPKQASEMIMMLIQGGIVFAKAHNNPTLISALSSTALGAITIS